MQSYYSSHDQPNEKTAVNLMARRLSDKWDRETKRFTNGFIKLGKRITKRGAFQS
jgi:hypothetical protein